MDIPAAPVRSAAEESTVGAATDRAIAALRTTHEHLAQRVPALTDDELGSPSGAHGWTVAQVLNHLGSGAEIGLLGLDAARAGQDAPEADAYQQVWGRWDALSRREQAAGCLRANDELVRAYESIDSSARQSLRFALPFLTEPADLGLVASMRLNEAAHHSWDVDVAFDPAARLVPAAATVLVDALVGPLSFLVRFLGKPERLGGRQATLTIRTTEPERELQLEIHEVVEIGAGSGSLVEGVLTAPSEVFLRLLQGRLASPHTPSGISVSGPLDLDELRQLFSAA